MQFKNKVILVKSEQQRKKGGEEAQNDPAEVILSNYQKYLLENKPAPYRQPSKFSNISNSTENAAKKLLK